MSFTMAGTRGAVRHHLARVDQGRRERKEARKKARFLARLRDRLMGRRRGRR